MREEVKFESNINSTLKYHPLGFLFQSTMKSGHQAATIVKV